MDKEEFRVLIKHWHLRGKSGKQTKKKLDECYGKSAPSYSTVKYWFAEFKRGRTSTKDEHAGGAPKTVIIQETIKKIHDIVLNDAKMKVREIAEAVAISTGSVVSILHERLNMRQLNAKWVPLSLPNDQKRERIRICQHCLDMVGQNSDDFLHQIVVIDETWIHRHTPPVLATVFWDSNGILFIDYVENGKTINSNYFCALLDRLKNEMAEKRSHLSIFLQDNVPEHKSTETLAKIHELGFKLLPHHPNSPDLAPSDYHLFKFLKRWLQGKRFATNKEVEREIDGYFEGLQTFHYSKGIEMLKHRWTKCIESNGDYVEE